MAKQWAQRNCAEPCRSQLVICKVRKCTSHLGISLGITLAFTVILATVAFAPRITDAGKDIPDWFIWTFMALQLYGIFFLIAGGWLALKTLRVARNYIWTLQDERDNNTMEAKNAEISWYLQNNQEVSVLKSNFLDASYSCIRNGVAALAISAMLVLIFIVLNLDP